MGKIEVHRDDSERNRRCPKCKRPLILGMDFNRSSGVYDTYYKEICPNHRCGWTKSSSSTKRGAGPIQKKPDTL